MANILQSMGPALSGAGQAFQQGARDIQAQARDERTRPIEALNVKMAQDQLKDMEPKKISEIDSVNPNFKYMHKAMVNMGMLTGQEDSVTPAQMKEFAKAAYNNPVIFKDISTQSFNDNKQAVDNVDAAIKKVQEKIAKDNEDPIKRLDPEAQKKNQQELAKFAKMREDASAAMEDARSNIAHADFLKLQKDVEKMPPADKELYNTLAESMGSMPSLVQFQDYKNSIAQKKPSNMFRETGRLRDGRTVVFSSDPNNVGDFVVNKDGSIDRYDKDTHGEIVRKAMLGTFTKLSTDLPGYTISRDTGLVYKDGKELTPGETNKLQSKIIDMAQRKAEARQRGSGQAASINAANDMYQFNLPRIIELRQKVAEKGLFKDTKLTDVNSAKQWLLEKTSDPDYAELKGKVKLMADALQKTLGGNQGGEWAFKVADTLLNTSYQGEAFERRLRSHGDDLATLAESRRSFGEKPVSRGAEDMSGHDPLGILGGK